MEAVIQQLRRSHWRHVFMMARKRESVLNLMGALRLELARRENGFPREVEHAVGS